MSHITYTERVAIPPTPVCEAPDRFYVRGDLKIEKLNYFPLQATFYHKDFPKAKVVMPVKLAPQSSPEQPGITPFWGGPAIMG